LVNLPDAPQARQKDPDKGKMAQRNECPLRHPVPRGEQRTFEQYEWHEADGAPDQARDDKAWNAETRIASDLKRASDPEYLIPWS
jgi:hypothetical protein